MNSHLKLYTSRALFCANSAYSNQILVNTRLNELLPVEFTSQVFEPKLPLYERKLLTERRINGLLLYRLFAPRQARVSGILLWTSVKRCLRLVNITDNWLFQYFHDVLQFSSFLSTFILIDPRCYDVNEISKCFAQMMHL